jgi:hypothetical protein
MLEPANNRCSIYEDRPRTCRRYDCRIFAATGIPVADNQPEVADRVREWKFTYATKAAREQHRRVKAAALFLQAKRELFPSGTLPSHPTSLAAFALHVHPLFAAPQTDPELVAAITQLAGVARDAFARR